MTIGCIGFGKMGQNVVLHLLEGGINVVGYNRTTEVIEQFKTKVAALDRSNVLGTFTPASYPTDVLTKLEAPHIIWLMVKAGQPVDDVLDILVDTGLSQGDIVIDGGNSFYKDSVRRYKKLNALGIHYIDCGTSGGLEGARSGACLMLGGDKEVVERLHLLWKAVAAENGWAYMGPSGAGHFVKMVHNGVEYGFNQALGEGFEIMAKGPYQLDLAKIAQVWNHGSIVRSFLVELLARALEKDPRLESFTGKVGGGETGRWAVDTARSLGLSPEVLEEALEAREKSQTNPTFATKVVSALRKEYGGHSEQTTNSSDK
jgi:6-phosphogluconate dehydrogenase